LRALRVNPGAAPLRCNAEGVFCLFSSMTSGELGLQVVELLLIAIPIAAIAWTVTHEEVFREPREFCQRCSERAPHLIVRKFFYLFTCEYCFSHYVTICFLFI